MNTTRRHPRTLTEAFGPYAGRSLHVKTEPFHPADKAVLIASAIALLFVIAVMVLS